MRNGSGTAAASRARRRAPGHRVWLACTLVAACAPATFRAPPGVPAPQLDHRGPHFTVVCHYACGAAGADALAAAEAAWDVALGLLSLEDRMSGRQLAIHLWATPADYEAVEFGLTGGRLRQNRAMTHSATMTSHITAHPFVLDAVTRRFGMMYTTRRSVAHEAFHLAVRALSPRAGQLPEWLREGLATWTEIEVLVALGLAPDRASEPVSSTRAYVLRQRRAAGMPPLHVLLGNADTLAIGPRYAFYQYFFEFLRQSPRARINRLLAELDRIPGRGASWTEAVEVRLFGNDREATLRALEAEFDRFIGGLEPQWVEAHRTLAVVGDTMVQVGYAAGAETWRWNPVLPPPFEITGRVEPLGPESQEASVLVALDSGFLAIRFEPGGGVTVTRQNGTDRPTAMITANATRRAAVIPFRIRVERDGVIVWTGDSEVIRLREPGLRPFGRWGVAVPPAANALWYDVVARPIALPR